MYVRIIKETKQRNIECILSTGGGGLFYPSSEIQMKHLYSRLAIRAIPPVVSKIYSIEYQFPYCDVVVMWSDGSVANFRNLSSVIKFLSMVGKFENFMNDFSLVWVFLPPFFKGFLDLFPQYLLNFWDFLQRVLTYFSINFGIFVQIQKARI